MTEDNTRSNFTNRDFVAMVRAELAAAGRPDVAIERSWIDEDEPGYQFLLHVPVGTELSIPLKVMDSFFDTRTDEDRKWHAVEFAKALINLRSAEKTLVKYAQDVRRAANAEVADARAKGLDVALVVVPWTPPAPLDGVGDADLLRVQIAVEGGDWRESVQSLAWVGYAVAKALGLDAQNPAHKHRVRAMLKKWVQTGALRVEDRPDAKRMMRPCVVVGRWAEPSLGDGPSLSIETNPQDFATSGSSPGEHAALPHLCPTPKLGVAGGAEPIPALPHPTHHPLGWGGVAVGGATGKTDTPGGATAKPVGDETENENSPLISLAKANAQKVTTSPADLADREDSRLAGRVSSVPPEDGSDLM